MRTHGLNHLSDTELLRDLRALLVRERGITAEVLAHLAEVDSRRLYVPAGYSSMFAYSVGELGLSEDAAYKRIQAARASRKCPAILEAVADGRLHLTGLGLLAPHLTTENAIELVRAATKKTKAEIEHLLASRFPRPDLPTRIQAIAPPSAPSRSSGLPIPESTGPLATGGQLAPAQVGNRALGNGGPTSVQIGTTPAKRPGTCAPELAPAQVGMRVPSPRPKPLSAESYGIQFTIGKATYGKLQHVQALLSHELPSGDLAQVFDRALDALAEKLEKRKFAATSKPRPRACRSAADSRHIPAHVKRAVWKRDQGQCTFVSPTGHRCGARKFLEFDHAEPVARGGQATVAGIRLRCRAHNLLEAERAFGREFMNGKRQEAQRATLEARTGAAAVAAQVDASGNTNGAAALPQDAPAVAEEQAKDVMACLRELGFRTDEARRAVENCETSPDMMLEERVKASLQYLGRGAHARTSIYLSSR